MSPDHDHPEVVLGVVLAPGMPTALVTSLADDLAGELEQLAPGVRWRVEPEQDRLVTPPVHSTELVAAARERLLDRGWDLVVVLTDLPLRVGRRPVKAHASPVQGVGLVSVPALGAVSTWKKARAAVLGLVDDLLGEPDDTDDDPEDAAEWAERRARRIRALGAEVDDDSTISFTARVLTGNLGLLLGMVRANRPWRLAAKLSRALVAALTAGILVLITPDMWLLADAYGDVRLVLVTVGAVLALGITLVVGAGLWERSRHRGMRQQVLLLNVATVLTVLVGVTVFYVALFSLALLSVLLLLPPSLIGDTVGHSVGWLDQVRLAWLTSSLAAAAGALGAGLETDEAVREAAYSSRPMEDDELG